MFKKSSKEPKNSGNISRVCDAAQGSQSNLYAGLDVKAMKAEFNHLRAELDGRVAQITRARLTIKNTVPFLSNMQALLSQRGSNRKKILRDAGLPTWTSFLEEYAKKTSYTVRQIRNLIRDFRGLSTTKKNAGPGTSNSKEMLQSLLDLLEHYGEHLPAAVITRCRYTKDALTGKIDKKEWRDRNREQRLLLERTSATACPSKTADHGSAEDTSGIDQNAVTRAIPHVARLFMSARQIAMLPDTVP
jgi:hypothetical protein